MESNIIEIYIDRNTKELIEFVPAMGMTMDEKELPDDAIFITQINIDRDLDLLEELAEL